MDSLKDRGRVKDTIEYPLVPPGDYDAAYWKHSIFSMYGGAEKLRVFFQVIDQGPAFEARIPWFNNVTIISKKNHRWTAGTRTTFMRTFSALTGYDPRKHGRVIPISWLKGNVYQIKVVTVTQDRRKRPIPEGLQYSKVVDISNVE